MKNMPSMRPRIFKHLFALSIAAAISGASVAAPQSIQIIPAAPRYLEPVYARIQQPGTPYSSCIYGAQVTMAGSVLTVEYQREIDLCNYSVDVELGRFPAGTFTVNLLEPKVTFSSPTDPRASISTQFTVGPSTANPDERFPGKQPIADYSGLWWSSSESGWGLSIAQGATNAVFAVWFVYGPSGEPIWYTLQPGSWTTFNSYSGPIFKTTGPDFKGAFNPAAVGVTQVGTGTLSFAHGNSGTLNYVIDGQRTLKNIERQIIE
ncbi:hypothetical protein BH11PSE11_BH11PSE11_34590 [soil metagenome]